jgi:biofilm PGA synthesis N-glycosyltransferase PgaC
LQPFGISPLPSWWGSALALTYLVQAVVSVSIDTRFEKGIAGSIFWIIWYPLVFWVLQAATAIAGLPRALVRSRHARGTWVSPDRGIR